MSYAIRNTLLLLLFFVIVAGGGFSYIHFVQKSVIEELESIHEEKQDEFNEMDVIAATYPTVQEAVRSAEEFIETYDKVLFPTHDPDQIYKFLTEINTEWPRVEFNFVFTDSVTHDQFGIVISSIDGTGPYRGVYNFINRIENSRPVQKLENIQITPVDMVGEYGNADFNLELKSYYERSSFLETSQEDLQIAMRFPGNFHNPFFALIRDVEANEDELAEVENSKLIGISRTRIFLRNQLGRLENLSLNDRVYLGRLQHIDAQRGRAVFRLNKGGITEEVTLEIQR